MDLCHQQYHAYPLQADKPVPERHRDERQNQYVLETLLNCTRDEGETLLVLQGWVNYLDMAPSLTAKAGDGDQVTTMNWQHNQTNPLKDREIP